jgi:hypothetical protein
MLRKMDGNDQAVMAPARIAPLDRARTFIILLVLLHHSVINYTYFGHGDRMRWLGFDLVVLFNDSFFMAFMFLSPDCSCATAWRERERRSSCVIVRGGSACRIWCRSWC